MNKGSYGDVYDDIGGLLAGAVVTGAVATAFRFDQLAVGVRFEGLKVFGGAEDHRPTIATATAVRTTTRLVFLPVEGDAPIPAAPRANDEPGFIYKLQRG